MESGGGGGGGALLSGRAVLGAAIIGVIGAATAIIVEHYSAERRRMAMAQELARLDHQVASMREELQTLRELQSKQLLKKQLRSSTPKRPSTKTKKQPSNDTTDSTLQNHNSYASDDQQTDYNSVVQTDSSDEFYEMESDEEEKYVSKKSNGTSPSKLSKYEQIIQSADKLFNNGTDDNEAEKILKEFLVSSRDSLTSHEAAEVLWRLGKYCQRQSNVHEKNDDMDLKKEVIFKGIELCKEAVEIDPDNPEAHKWYAILVGLRGDFVGTKDKLKDGYLFKMHVDIALSLNPQDFVLYHLMGRFKAEIAALSWLERKLATALYHDVPMATYEEALDDFKKADEICPTPWKENKLRVAKILISLKQYSEAIKWLDDLIAATTKTSDDQVVHAEALELIRKYSSYRK